MVASSFTNTFTPRAPLCVLIPILNEEKNLARCLASVAFASQVVVVDSHSSDHSVEIAKAHGAQVFQFDYDKQTGWPKKKNWALENIPFKHEWVLILDADEVLTPELAAEISAVVSGTHQAKNAKAAGTGDAYFIARRFRFMGRWIKGCGYWPSWNLRLFKHKLGRYERIGTLGDTGTGDNEVHEHVVLARGKAGYLENAFDHFAYPDVATFIEKHNRYSTWEAHVQLMGGAEVISKRRFLRRISLSLPFRPTLRFLYSYFFELGILDGYEGFVLCKLLAWYELASMAKTHELLRERGLTSPLYGNQTAKRACKPALPGSPPEMSPEKSPWTLGEKIRRALWMLVGKPLFRASFHNWYALRAAWLRCFGAQMGARTRIRPSVDIEIPWMLSIDDDATVGDHAILYSLGAIHIGARSVVSQYAHLCAGTHDHTKKEFPLQRKPIAIGSDAWIGADAFIGAGVCIGARAVVGARASVFKDVPPDEIWGGNPAQKIKDRVLESIQERGL